MTDILSWAAVAVGIIAVFAVAVICIYKFLKLPTSKQIEALKEWLLLAVTEAEKELGGGTGALKLRRVYDLAVSKFSWVSLIGFSTFSGWVDEALLTMKQMLTANKAVAEYVEGGKNDGNA